MHVSFQPPTQTPRADKPKREKKRPRADVASFAPCKRCGKGWNINEAGATLKETSKKVFDEEKTAQVLRR
jgi:hypothetical protein